MRRSTLGLTILVLALLAAGAGMAVYKVWPMLNPEVVARAPLNEDCKLRDGACSVTFDEGGTVTLRIEPRYIPPLYPLDFTLQMEGIDVHGDAVEVDLVGLNMRMGYNRPVLPRTGPGSFGGKVTIPVCVRARMDWEARVMMRTDAGLVVAPFRFSTYKAHAEQ